MPMSDQERFEELQQERIEELQKALEPFAAMHRNDSEGSELACQRGTASDATYIFSRDFANAAKVLSESKQKSAQVLSGQ